MPNKKSAIEEMRKAQRRRIFNLRRLRAMRASLKQIKKLLSENKKDEALSLVPQAYKAIDKAAKRGVIKKNTASRKKKRLMKKINQA